MDTPFLLSVAGTGLTILFGVIGYLLQRKDATQEHEIAELKAKHASDVEVLWRKHDEDAGRLHKLELEIAHAYYSKHELDNRFGELKAALDTGLAGMRDEVRSWRKELSDNFKAR